MLPNLANYVGAGPFVSGGIIVYFSLCEVFGNMNTYCAWCVVYNSFFDSQKIEATIDKLLRVLLVKADYFFIVSHDKK